MKKLFGIMVLGLFLQGCTGAPVGWGGTYEILQSNSKSITILFDPIVGSNSIWKPAADHCQKYEKESVPTSQSKQGLLYVQIFECK